MKISHKLTLTIVGITTVVVIVSAALARWSFDHGFRDFIYGLEAQRLSRISQKVVAQYAKSDGWRIEDYAEYEQFLQSNGSSRPDHRGGPPPHGDSRGGGHRPPPHHDERGGFDERPPMDYGEHMRPPREEAGGPRGNEIVHLVNELRREELQARSGPRRSNDSGPPVSLLDNKGGLIAGPDPEEFDGYPVSVPLKLKNHTIGELVSWPNMNPANKLASDFSHQQWFASFVIAVSCISLAALLSWLISKRLLAPVRRVLKDVDSLAKGHYVLPAVEERADELGQVLKDIAKLGDTLESNRTAKNRWFADISHELRTPLAVMMSEIESLKAGYRAFDEKQLASFEEEVQLLNRLVNDLYQLSLSDVGGLQYNASENNMSTIVERSIANQSTMAMAKGLDIHVAIEPDLRVRVDGQRMEQLATNLLTNSIKYTDEQGEIWVSLRQRNKQLLLSIEDTTPGVPQQECDQLFQPLYRRDSSRRARLAGAGLGMAICRNIVHAHNGDISAAPSQRGGLRVDVVLPIADADQS